jgi:glycosyltransferase involved in cell wall biosynthesis
VNITIVSQYFGPESGATQNRLGAFTDGLIARGHSVTVLCEQPCHPAGVFQPGFGRRPVYVQRGPRCTVRRLWVAASPKKTTRRRLAFYGTFAGGAAAALAVGRRPDVVFASSPPLPAVLGVATVARARRIPLVVDVRDIWPAAAEALGELSSPRVLAFFGRAERSLYKQAQAVTATTQPFCRHIDVVAGRAVSVHLPNGALDALVDLDLVAPPARSEFVVGYAGNLGIAQGLGIVLDAASELRDRPVRFVVLGDGAVKPALLRDAQDRGLDNVEFRPGVPVSEVAAFLQSCDALMIPLRDHELLGDFIPSKLYDAMAVGRPVLAALRGEGADLVSRTRSGLVVDPENGAQLAGAVERLRTQPDLARGFGAAGRDAARGMKRSLQVDTLDAVLRLAVRN